MKKTITFNAKCRQCMHFEILDEDDELLKGLKSTQKRLEEWLEKCK